MRAPGNSFWLRVGKLGVERNLENLVGGRTTLAASGSRCFGQATD